MKNSMQIEPRIQQNCFEILDDQLFNKYLHFFKKTERFWKVIAKNMIRVRGGTVYVWLAL